MGAVGQNHLFDKQALLRAHPFFRDLGDTIIDRLAPRVISTKIKRGAVIFRKGDIGSKLYAVRAGAVRISTPSEEGKDAIFNLVVPGELFGEIAFLDGGQRTADAVAIDNCELMVIERRDFIPLIRDNPEVAIRLITILCGRLRRTSEQVEDIVFLGLSSRLAGALAHRRPLLNREMNGRPCVGDDQPDALSRLQNHHDEDIVHIWAHYGTPARLFWRDHRYRVIAAKHPPIDHWPRTSRGPNEGP